MAVFPFSRSNSSMTNFGEGLCSLQKYSNSAFSMSSVKEMPFLRSQACMSAFL